MEEICRFLWERRLQCESTLQPPLLFLRYKDSGELAEGSRGYTRTRRSRPQRSAAYCWCSRKTRPLCFMPFGRCPKRVYAPLRSALHHSVSFRNSEWFLAKKQIPSVQNGSFASCRFRHMSKYNENEAKVPRFHRNYRVII